MNISEIDVRNKLKSIPKSLSIKYRNNDGALSYRGTQLLIESSSVEAKL